MVSGATTWDAFLRGSAPRCSGRGSAGLHRLHVPHDLLLHFGVFLGRAELQILVPGFSALKMAGRDIERIARLKISS